MTPHPTLLLLLIAGAFATIFVYLLVRFIAKQATKALKNHRATKAAAKRERDIQHSLRLMEKFEPEITTKRRQRLF